MAGRALVQIVAATDGLVVSSGKSILDGYDKTPAQPRYDVVYLLDEQGWYYRYSHLHSIDAAIKPGVKVKKGQRGAAMIARVPLRRPVAILARISPQTRAGGGVRRPSSSSCGQIR
jgi:hypothetical protein